jgi:hypothetical protein
MLEELSGGMKEVVLRNLRCASKWRKGTGGTVGDGGKSTLYEE